MADVNSAAEAMGVPPELVSRSAAARATAAGTTTDEVLAAWSGGGSVAAKAPAEAEPEAAEAAPEPAEPASEPSRPTPPADLPPPSLPTSPETEPRTPPPVASAPGKPPVLVGVSDNPWAIVAGAVALFVAVVLLALVGPSIPEDSPGARSSEISYSSAAVDGMEHYVALGCTSCHTQMIRPVVADVGLGPVTLGDTNQVLGTRRYGPDLSAIGTRMAGAQIEAIVRGEGSHPAYNLSFDDMFELLAFLTESSPSTGASQ